MVYRTAYKRTFEAMCQHSLDEFAGSAGYKFKIDTGSRSAQAASTGERRSPAGCGFK
jgi:hypothetical protein